MSVASWCSFVIVSAVSLLGCGVNGAPPAPEEMMAKTTPTLGLDGSGDWASVLTSATADQAAAAALAGVQPAVVLTPQSPEVTRLPPEARAVVSAPALVTAADGARVLTFWMGQPPGFGPVQVQVTHRDGAPATVTRTPLDELLGAGDQEAMLLRFLTEGSRKEKQGAAKALGERGSQAAVPGLIVLLADPYAGARADAAEALGKIRSPEAIPALEAALIKELDLAAGMKMVFALRETGGEAAKAALGRAATSSVEKTLAQQAREAASAL